MIPDIDDEVGERAGAVLARACIAGLAALSLQACGPSGGGAAVAQLSPPEACMKSLDPATIDICRSALTAEPNNAALRRRMGLLRLKSGSLSAARQAYQIALSQDANDAEAEFGLGLTLEAIGEAGGNLKKLDAVKRNPAVVDIYRKYGVSEPDLLTYEVAPEVVSVAATHTVREMSPNVALTSSLGVDVKCLVGAAGALHDCKVLTPLTPDKAPFGEAATKIVMLSKVKPARLQGKVLVDAPVTQTMVFEP